MFERNRIDSKPEPGTVLVEIELYDGTLAKGRLIVAAGHAPLEALNGQGGFVEFVPYGGEPSYIAKSTIAALRPLGVPRAAHLSPRSGAANDFDPHAILGVSTESTWDEVRQAYVQHSKAYHPDRYSSATLPAEVQTYLETMARRVNAAYAALEGSNKAVRRVLAERSQPIYTSAPRT